MNFKRENCKKFQARLEKKIKYLKMKEFRGVEFFTSSIAKPSWIEDETGNTFFKKTVCRWTQKLILPYPFFRASEKTGGQ